MTNAQIKLHDCKECFRIKCKKCGWEPNKREVSKIISGDLKACPDCGRKP